MSTLDWLIILIFIIITLGISFYYKNQASKSLSEFFLGGRNLSWYIAGLSMVATTFAADTPLWVTEKIKQHGISGNWLWWNMVISGMLTTFFFARLWRRANIITELEFMQIRYSGPAANFLRGFKSIYLGLLLNGLVIAWVNLAMVKILAVFFNLDNNQAFIGVICLMIFIVIYSSMSGLKGVAVSDAFQFTLAMGGCILLAIFMLNSPEIGGVSGLKEHLKGEEWRFNFFPEFSSHTSQTGNYAISFLAFLSFIGVQWWASWYPGAEPGGGGYVVQRMMSTKDEKNAVWATLFFQVSHYALRPWPWIIVGLCCLVVYPQLSTDDAGKGFVLAMKDYMPSGFLGLMFAAFLGAYMSTISTQLNWGASFLTNDFYKFYFKKKESTKQDVKAARISTVVIMLFSSMVTYYVSKGNNSIDSIVTVLIGAGAGLGSVLILRWYWWRINAWSELSATIVPIFFFWVSKYKLEAIYGTPYKEANGTLIFTAMATTIVWLIVTYVTKPTKKEVLISFYKNVRPLGNWKAVRAMMGEKAPSTRNKELVYLFISWVSATFFIYSVLFFIGKLIFQEYTYVVIWAIIGLLNLGILAYAMRRTDSLNEKDEIISSIEENN